MEQGATNIPAVINEPLEMDAPMSRKECTTSANASTCSASQSVSSWSVRFAAVDIIKWTSTLSREASISNAFTAYMTPESQVMPIITRFFCTELSSIEKTVVHSLDCGEMIQALLFNIYLERYLPPAPRTTTTVLAAKGIPPHAT